MAIRMAPTGKLIKSYMAANGIRQIDLARQSGYSEKQISLILTGKADLPERVDLALSQLIPGTAAGYWLNYDKKYQRQAAKDNEIASSKNYKELNDRLNLSKLFSRTQYSKAEQLELLEKALDTDDVFDYFTNPRNQTLKVAYLKGVGNVSDEYVSLWVDVVLYLRAAAGINDVDFKGVETLKLLMESDLKRALLAIKSDTFERNLRFFCKKAGINLIILNNLFSSSIRGMTFSKEGRIYIILTDRFKSIEFTSFAFVHELEHIINGDITLDKDEVEYLSQDVDFEQRATKAALDFLLDGSYEDICKSVEASTNKSKTILEFANALHVSPGMIVTILQHNKTIDYSAQRHFLCSYESKPDFEI